MVGAQGEGGVGGVARGGGREGLFQGREELDEGFERGGGEAEAEGVFRAEWTGEEAAAGGEQGTRAREEGIEGGGEAGGGGWREADKGVGESGEAGARRWRDGGGPEVGFCIVGDGVKVGRRADRVRF